jgi:uncharacterized protein YjeT (DUF2065 family)
MRFTTVAVVLGLVIGVLTGGKVGNLGRRRLRAWPLLIGGAALQLAPSAWTLLASYLCLLAFALANIRIVGLGVLTIGLALNALVVSCNGGMPVRPAAVEAAGLVKPGEPVMYAGKHKVETRGTRLRFLGDILPVSPLRQVLSFGDLVMAVGLTTALAWLTRRPPEGRHAEDQLADERAGSRDK